MANTVPEVPSKVGEPTWEAAFLLPLQGQWTEATFLQLHTNNMAELVDGRLEILPMPTWLHQLILDFLLTHFKNHIRKESLGGVVLMAPLPTKLFPGTIREPDLLYVSEANIPTNVRGYPERVDLVLEIVSEGTEARRRDYEEKRLDYAKAGIREYWIVDPNELVVTIFVLENGEYRVQQTCTRGTVAHSVLLAGLTIAVDDIWALADTPPR